MADGLTLAGKVFIILVGGSVSGGPTKKLMRDLGFVFVFILGGRRNEIRGEDIKL